MNVYQQDLPYVRVGDPVTIQTDAYPDVFHGRISYVAAAWIRIRALSRRALRPAIRGTS